MKLQDWIDEHGVSLDVFAEHIGVTTWSVQRWLSGKYKPRMNLQKKIYEYTMGDVKIIDWIEPGEQDQSQLDLEGASYEDKIKYHGRERGLGFDRIDRLEILTAEEKEFLKALRVEAREKKRLDANEDVTTKRLAEAMATNIYGDNDSLQMVEENALLEIIKAEKVANKERVRWHLGQFFDHLGLYGAIYPKDYWKSKK